MGVVAAQIRVAPTNDGCLQAIERVAHDENVPTTDLRLQALLHLPRLANDEGFVDAQTVDSELHALAKWVQRRIEPVAELANAPDRPPVSPKDLVLTEAPDVAQAILSRFHYLGSFRLDSENLVCWTRDEKPVALAAISPFDLWNVQTLLPADLSADGVRVLSRVFAFDWAPANTLTWMFRRVAGHLRKENSDVQLLITYVNPNMGFTAASYRAGNWTLIAREGGTRYAYLDGRYVTDRELIRRYDTSDPALLEPRLGRHVQYSQMSLRPLEIYALPLTRRARSWLAQVQPRLIPRPTP